MLSCVVLLCLWALRVHAADSAPPPGGHWEEGEELEVEEKEEDSVKEELKREEEEVMVGEGLRVEEVDHDG